MARTNYYEVMATGQHGNMVVINCGNNEKRLTKSFGRWLLDKYSVQVKTPSYR